MLNENSLALLAFFSPSAGKFSLQWALRRCIVTPCWARTEDYGWINTNTVYHFCTKHRISHTKLRVPLSLVSRSQDPFLYIFSRLLPISISDVLQLLADRIWHFTVWAMWVLKFYTKHRGKRGREDDGVGCKGGLYLRVFNPPRYSQWDNAVKVLIP